MIKFKRITAIVFSAIIMLTGCSTAGNEQSAKEEIMVTLPTDLTDEEMAIWETMPQVVTMRINSERFYSEEFDDKKETLEILFIEKNGAVRCFKWAGHEKFYKDYTVETEFEWAAQKFTEADKYEITGTVDVHKLIEFYDTMSKIDTSSKMDKVQHPARFLCMEPMYEYYYSIYGALENGKVIEFSEGYHYGEDFFDDPYGYEALRLYLEMDPFKKSIRESLEELD